MLPRRSTSGGHRQTPDNWKLADAMTRVGSGPEALNTLPDGRNAVSQSEQKSEGE